MKNFYIVISTDNIGTKNILTNEIEENHRYYADVIKVSSSENLAHKLSCIGGLIHANICETKKEAERIAREWNKTYKENGTFLYA